MKTAYPCIFPTVMIQGECVSVAWTPWLSAHNFSDYSVNKATYWVIVHMIIPIMSLYTETGTHDNVLPIAFLFISMLLMHFRFK